MSSVQQDPVDLDKARALADAATRGPWALEEHDDGQCWTVAGPLDSEVAVCDDFAAAQFIAATRSLLPALVAECERLRDALAAARAETFREAADAIRQLRIHAPTHADIPLRYSNSAWGGLAWAEESIAARAAGVTEPGDTK